MKSIVVICAIDGQIEGVEEISAKLKELGIEVGVATYGNKHIEPSVALKKFANFYDSPRQTYIDLDREFHCFEMVAYMNISKHFYDKGYDRVYICHHDVWIKDNPLPYYEKEMKGNWSFVVPLAHSVAGRDCTLEEAEKLGGRDMLKTNLRLSHEFLILNKKFVEFFYKKYKNDKGIWKFFEQYDMHSDLTMFDFYPEWNGFKAKVIESCVIHKPRITYTMKDGKLLKI